MFVVGWRHRGIIMIITDISMHETVTTHMLQKFLFFALHLFHLVMEKMYTAA